jgi:hypothetical protein
MKKDKRATASLAPQYSPKAARKSGEGQEKKAPAKAGADISKKSENLKREINTRRPGKDVDASESVGQE